MGVGSHASDNDPEVLEREKQKNLEGETESHPRVPQGWNERLASDSEAAVVADHCVPEAIEEMQKHSIEHLLEGQDCSVREQIVVTATTTTTRSTTTAATV
ncbi:hypothetical protein WJX72_000798 [[Myrmecia] bisecta]|uniref:Uncharacterized protein n=1 Tax=[Myrmecia] bisecta TaxID=41462 RepID=A0AAW1Q057_9CHLO